MTSKYHTSTFPQYVLPKTFRLRTRSATLKHCCYANKYTCECACVLSRRLCRLSVHARRRRRRHSTHLFHDNIFFCPSPSHQTWITVRMVRIKIVFYAIALVGTRDLMKGIVKKIQTQSLNRKPEWSGGKKNYRWNLRSTILYAYYNEFKYTNSVIYTFTRIHIWLGELNVNECDRIRSRATLYLMHKHIVSVWVNACVCVCICWICSWWARAIIVTACVIPIVVVVVDSSNSTPTTITT